jgi:hypothetical protein
MMKIGAFTATNDPRESKDWDFGLWSSRHASIGQVNPKMLSELFSATLKSTAKVACFCADSPTLSGDHTRDILLRGFARPRMWSQYADKHTGVCLVFDKKRLIDRIRDTFPGFLILKGNVAYRNRSPFSTFGKSEFSIDIDSYRALGHDQYAAHHLNTHYASLFFEKLEDWRDENEWRILLIGGSSKDCFVPIDDSLVGVVHGVATSPEMSKRLIRLSDEPGVEHMGLLWNNHSPWYDIGGPHWRYEDRRMLRRIRRRRQ